MTIIMSPNRLDAVHSATVIHPAVASRVKYVSKGNKGNENDSISQLRQVLYLADQKVAHFQHFISLEPCKIK